MRHLRKALPMICGCALTVIVVYALFGRTVDVYKPAFTASGASTATGTGRNTTSGAIVSRGYPSVVVIDGPEPTTTIPAITIPASTTTAPELDPSPPAVITVIGDTYTAGSDGGGQSEHNWTTLVEADLARRGYSARLDVDAATGSGYVHEGVGEATFLDQINRTVTAESSLVVLFGSRYDSGGVTMAQVQDSAEAALRRIDEIAPDASVLVIGAPWVEDIVPRYITDIEWMLKAEAKIAGARYLDPIADHWFYDDPTLIGTDGATPNDRGHAYMAAKILPEIEALLPAD